MKIRILKSKSKFYWYSAFIGQEFDYIRTQAREYIVSFSGQERAVMICDAKKVEKDLQKLAKLLNAEIIPLSDHATEYNFNPAPVMSSAEWLKSLQK